MSYSPDIALFTRWTSGGGAERVMVNLANGFAEKGLKVDLLIIESRRESEQDLHQNIQLINFDIRATTRKKYIPSSLQSTKVLPKLIGYMRETRPSVLMSATHYINETALLAKLFAWVPTKVMVTEHTFLSMEAQSVEQISSRLVPLTVKALYPFADEIIAVSHGVARDLENHLLYSRNPVRVIYNSVVTPEIVKLAQEKIEHPWFQKKEQPIIIGGGRFVRQKDFPTLLRAFAQLRKHSSARLVLIGDGREYSALNRLSKDLDIEEDLWFPGFVDNPYAFLRQADVFVLSSAWEGLPTVLIEALALGTPVVSTNCPSGPAEILDDGKYGHLVTVGDSHALSLAIAAALEGDQQTVPDSWLQQFTPEYTIKKYMEVAGV